MAKQNGRNQGTQAVPAARAPAPPRGAVVAEAISDRCRCGGQLSQGTTPDGALAVARIDIVPADYPPLALMRGGPQLEATLLICADCKRVELVWSGK